MMWKEKEEKEEEKEQYESCNTLTPSERGSDGGRPQLGEMEGERCPPERAFTTFLTRKQDNMFVCLR